MAAAAATTLCRYTQKSVWRKIEDRGSSPLYRRRDNRRSRFVCGHVNTLRQLNAPFVSRIHDAWRRRWTSEPPVVGLTSGKPHQLRFNRRQFAVLQRTATYRVDRPTDRPTVAAYFCFPRHRATNQLSHFRDSMRSHHPGTSASRVATAFKTTASVAVHWASLRRARTGTRAP